MIGRRLRYLSVVGPSALPPDQLDRVNNNYLITWKSSFDESIFIDFFTLFPIDEEESDFKVKKMKNLIDILKKYKKKDIVH